MVERLYSDVEALISAILGSDTLAGLETLRSHNEYTFQHSVDVAVIGALLGTRMGLPAPRLRDLALGCRLHDLGKLSIDAAILDKPGKLTAEEFAAVKEHPRMGLELIRRMPVHSLLPAHVAYQHHEHQRGGGYPQALVGDNRIGRRLAEERIGAGRSPTSTALSGPIVPTDRRCPRTKRSRRWRAWLAITSTGRSSISSSRSCPATRSAGGWRSSAGSSTAIAAW